jgi:hypothetical protein
VAVNGLDSGSQPVANPGYGAGGTCLEGAVDCVDTIVNEEPASDEPVTIGGAGGTCLAGAVDCGDTIVNEEPVSDEPVTIIGDQDTSPSGYGDS